MGFAADLPPTVTTRYGKTPGTPLMSDFFRQLAAEFRATYPELPPGATEAVNPSAYRDLLTHLDAGTLDQPGQRDLWHAWSIALWFDRVVSKYSMST